MEKSLLRRSLLKTRQSLSTEDWQQKSDRLCTHLQRSSIFSKARTVLGYFSYRREPDLSSLFTDRRRWGFPRCIDKSLSWHVWKVGEPRQKNVYGIFEPQPDAPKLEPDNVDLILVPAIACDVRGYRLGYGGGFYDRLLASSEWSSKPTVGIVFERDFLQSLPTEEWDQPLQAVCTETGLRIIP